MISTSLVLALMAGIGLMLALAPLGCFMMWRRMAYLGDAIAHFSILGIALSLATSWPIFIGILLSSGAAAFALSGLEGKKGLTGDTLLGVLAHAGLAFGMVVISLTYDGHENHEAGHERHKPEHHDDGHKDGHATHIDMEDFLFGADILALNAGDVLLIWGGSALILLLLVCNWNRLLTMCLSLDLAYAGGLSPRHYRLLLTLMLALVVAIAVQIVGVLLVTAMLIIPAATVRPFCQTPESMAIGASLVGISSCLLGIALSIMAGLPAGPSIVSTASALFIVSCCTRPYLQN